MTDTPSLPPDPEGMNDDRALWAAQALHAFRVAIGTDPEDALPDLLADLMHWCDRSGANFNDDLCRAYVHYEAETTSDTGGIAVADGAD